MDIHELIATERVVSHEPLVSSLPISLQEYGHHVLFALQNCHYNKNRIAQEVKRHNESPATLYPEGAEALAKQIPEGKALFVEIPLLIWAYIPLFELQSFISNVIRCCNYLSQIATKINNFELKGGREPDIGGYIREHKEKTDELSTLLKYNYSNWIAALDSRRNQYMHRLFKREFEGTLKWKFAKRQGKIVLESKVEILSEFGEILQFCTKSLELLETLLVKFKETLPPATQDSKVTP